jgi:hypothetical protein
MASPTALIETSPVGMFRRRQMSAIMILGEAVIRFMAALLD